MEKIEISAYLENLDKQSRKGTCKGCQKPVNWARDPLAAHKRASCPAASAEEKQKFAKRPKLVDLNQSYSSIDENSPLNTENCKCHLTEEQTAEISEKLATFFFRTGISLRLVESEALKDFVRALNPAYATAMPRCLR